MPRTSARRTTVAGRMTASEPGPGAGRSGALRLFRRVAAGTLIGILVLSAYGALVPAGVRCPAPGAVGCTGGILGAPIPSTTTNEQFFNISMYDYGFWIVDTTSGANESKVWTVFEGWLVHVNVTSLPPDSSVGGTAYHGIGVELNATGKQLLSVAAGVNKWNGGSFTAPTHAYYHQHIWCTIECGPGHGGMQSHILNIVPSTTVPTASVSASPKSGPAPLAVTFTASVSGGQSPYNTSWNFGDGTTAFAGTSTTHTYGQSGSYSATVTVRDANGAQTNASVAVSVAAAAPLNVTAAASPAAGTLPLLATLTAATVGGAGPFAYAWSFGDGANGSGNPVSHLYTAAGEYAAKVVVSDAAGTRASALAPVTVRGPTGPLSLNLSANVTTGAAPLAVSFQPTVTGGTAPYSMLWEFGDTSSGLGSTGAHTYATGGEYVATVFASDGAGRSGSASMVINVTGGPSAPLSSFLLDVPSGGGPPLAVAASLSVWGGTGPYSTPAWSFGDGATGSGALAAHSYANLGSFALTASASDAAGATARASATVHVIGLQLNISLNRTIGDAPFSVSAGTTVVGGTGSYGVVAWSWGDGTASQGSPANHSFPAATNGTVTITATVSDSGGASATASTTVGIDPPPVARLTVEVPKGGLPPVTVVFTLVVTGGSGNYSTDPYWSFGDGTTTRGPSPISHTYHRAGRFTATVRTNDSFGTPAAASLLVTEGLPPTAASGASAWTFNGIGDPTTAGFALMGLVAVSGLALLVGKGLRRPTAAAAPPGVRTPPARPVAPGRSSPSGPTSRGGRTP